MVLLTSEETLRKRTWDCEEDLYIHLQKKNRVLKSENEKLNYFNTLLQEFIVKDPNADSELAQFMGGLSSIVESQVLHLREQIREDEENDNVVVDPQYKFFLNHLRSHGKSNVLEIVEDGVFVKYEIENESSPVPWSPSFCANHACVNYKSKLRDRKSKGEEHSAGKRPNVNSNSVASDSRKCSRNKKLKDVNLAAAKSRAVKSVNVAPKKHKYAGNCKGGRKRKSLQKHTVPVNVKGRSVSAVKGAYFEQNEGQNIGHRKKGKKIDTPSSMETIVKEEIEDFDDDVDDAHDIRRPVEFAVVEHFWCDNEANARKLTEFRRKLVNELRRPYCEEEHKRLLQDITVRKPVKHHKDLRGVIKTYEEDYLGKSFLDHHLDLADAIDSARDDHPKVLNLLRGFFFWLRNLTHEGSFMPWRVPSCWDAPPQQ